MNYFIIQSNLDKMTVISLMMMTSKITLSTTAIATRYSTRYLDFSLLLDSKSKTTSRWGLAENDSLEGDHTICGGTVETQGTEDQNTQNI